MPATFCLETPVRNEPCLLTRIFNFYVPGLMISGPETLYRFDQALLLSVALTVALGIFLALRYQRHGWPWWLASGLVALLYLLYATLGPTAQWTQVVAEIANWSPIPVFAFGALLGAMVCALGWRHGDTSRGVAGAPVIQE